jgi:hypothetical protein
MPVTCARPSTVIGAAALDGAVESPEVLIGPVVDWIGVGVGFTLADFGWGAACASEETAKTVPVIRTENPKRMFFLPEWSYGSMNCGLHVYRCLALKLVFLGPARLLSFFAAMLPAVEAAGSIPFPSVDRSLRVRRSG